MPRLGLAIAPTDAHASPPIQAALATLSPSLLHLTLSQPQQPVQWAGIAELLSVTGAQLRLDFMGGVTAASLSPLTLALRDAGIKPESIALFSGTVLALSAARQAFPCSAIGAGTPHFFAQLNRMDDTGPADFLSFTICPIVHSADDAAPMTGLQSLPSLLATARARFPGFALRIGPSSLGARSSPLGKQPASDGMRRMALAQRDPRTRGLFGAAWLLGHIAQAALAGAETVSVMSLLGDAGVLDESADGNLFRHPSFFVLAELVRFKHSPAMTVSNAVGVVALARACDGRAEWLMANLTCKAIDMSVSGTVEAHVMDVVGWQAYANGTATSPWREMRVDSDGKIQLNAFAVAVAVAIQ